MRIAVIDIGTNSTRYLLADAGPGGRISRVETLLKTTRLGEGMGRRLLTERAMARTTAAVAEFWRRAQSKGAEKILVAATCAVREAANREDFVRLVQQATGLEMRVLSEREEACYTFYGVLTGFEVPEADLEKIAVVDVGGGSTELVWMEDGNLNASSLPLGAVRLTEQGEGIAVASLLRPVCRLIAGRRIFGTGGTITTLAAVAQGLAVYDPGRVHGYQLTAEKVTGLLARLARLSLEERKKVPGLQPERADVIVAGTRIVAELLECTGASGITVSECDILYGVAAEAASPVERKSARNL
ncbi:MAG: Ppx/GppA family phosphatase [Bacillota bacterium]|nr:hypothetical protein [Thermoanaerobacteraceae bacterium]